MNKHIIITPLYNEEKFLSTFISSIINQTLVPFQLILVDDNSTDNSKAIIEEYTSKYNWIKYVYHSSANSKSQGKKVINAFNFGTTQCNIEEADFISKIDCDLEFPENYFEKIAEGFSLNPKLGITGGIIEELSNKETWEEIPQAPYHIRGALKSYRIECFKEIGGLLPVLGWDGLDEMNALYRGWETQIISNGVKHFRPASKDYNKVKLSYELGIANYKNGANIFLASIRAIIKSKQKPYLRVGFSFIKGYTYAFKKRMTKNVDKKLARFINKFHTKRLLRLRRF